MGREGVSTEERFRILRLIENLTLGTAAVGYLSESMHGTGSPQPRWIMISRLMDLSAKQRLAKHLCSIRATGGRHGRHEEETVCP